MNRIVVAFGLGLLFGIGLLISGMTDPAKVLGFLDVTGAWDPSLALVMAGAVGVFGVAYRLALRKSRPVLAPSFDVPAARAIDRRLVAGALVFGVGWGLSGFCPGPALVSATFGEARVWAFVGAILVGMALVHGLDRSRVLPPAE